MITVAEAFGSAASVTSFPTAGINVISLQDMLEDLVGLESGIEPDSRGWFVGAAIDKKLRGLAYLRSKVPLITTQVVGERT